MSSVWNNNYEFCIYSLDIRPSIWYIILDSVRRCSINARGYDHE